MRSDKTYMALLGAYREVYARLSVDFSTVDKTDNWFMEYEMPESEQEEVLTLMGDKYKLTKQERSAVRNSFMSGCSPKFTKDESKKD